MKTIAKILLIIWLTLSIFSYMPTNAGIDLGESSSKIADSSIGAGWFTGGWDLISNIERVGLSILTTVKVVFGWVLVIFMVYTGAQMVLSLGSDEEELKKSKTSLWYATLWLVFINIPGTLFNAFNKTDSSTLDGRIWYSSWVRTPGNTDTNVFIDVFNFWYTLNTDIIWFIQVALSGIAIFMIIISGVKILTSRGKEEKITEQKNKITWSIIWLVFIWFVESWKEVVFEGKIGDWANFFGTMSNLALFFAWPIAIFFLTLAGYYYITSNGDEERIKKAKAIVINTLIATLILLASYTFLLDLQGISVPTI